MCRHFEERLNRLEDYIADIDDEIKGYEAAATFTGLSEKTLGRLVSEQKIPFKKDGRSISFSRRDLVDYKRNRRLGKNQQAPHQATYERLNNRRI